MDFDDSWDALLKPGKATVYFDNFDPKQFEPSATTYRGVNAWLLAELCRLIYKQESDEIGAAFSGLTRNDVLQKVGLEEVQFFNSKAAKKQGDTQCAIIRTQAGAASPFAALIFRGTTNLMDWLTNFQAFLIPWNSNGKVHLGFKEALGLVWDDVTAVLAHLDAAMPVFYAGHSLGAALATLAAAKKEPTALYTFGSPMVGDPAFGAALATRKAYRVVNNRDAVTTVPPPPLFRHLGELHYITHDSAMLVNPTEQMVALDRLKGDRWSLLTRDWHKHFTDAPEYLADHAPVNYVAHLERLA